MSDPVIAVFRGGISPEREISLGSGAAAFEALRQSFAQVEDFDIRLPEIPAAIDAKAHVVFSTLHGVFGEDGTMQTLLEERSIAFAGCGSASSDLCFDKQRTKATAAIAGVPVPSGVHVLADESDCAAELFAEFGPRVVVKPNRQGSSVGLQFVEDAAALGQAIAHADDDGCMVETCLGGREVTVGVLDGEAMGVVEIRPRSGKFDYESKYTKGQTEYLFPAPFDKAMTGRIRELAAIAFAACSCRDFARVDFIVEEGGPVLLEINTLPGLKETSLLPMSARCIGLDFEALVRRMTLPAVARHRASLAGAASESGNTP